ncbi:hypothetical protein PF008_g33181 [Phytophthora fragariae]|uniref:Uncharacterized protein n=1 Tax=Phytophthora fragariae TaxID=53985 RepID=A0A6G0PXU6_9STRA|nr:hypothetical protein PF008_g33181 [Phytophthora fragariae]
MVRPESAILRTPFMMSLAERASRPLVGSSMKMMLGCATSSTPMVTRFICSVDDPRMILSAMGPSSSSSMHSSTDSIFCTVEMLASWRSIAEKMSASRTVAESEWMSICSQ